MSENIIGGVFRIKLTQKKQMISARAVLIIIAVLSIIFAWNPDSSVFKIVSFAWAGFGATFGPVMLAALFWKRSNKWGALAGMIVGGVMVFAWKFGISKLGGAWSIYELLPAFIAATLAIVIVSLVTGKPDKSITDEFEEVSAEMKK
jgi:sodium/proline symporter